MTDEERTRLIEMIKSGEFDWDTPMPGSYLAELVRVNEAFYKLLMDLADHTIAALDRFMQTLPQRTSMAVRAYWLLRRQRELRRRKGR